MRARSLWICASTRMELHAAWKAFQRPGELPAEVDIHGLRDIGHAWVEEEGQAIGFSLTGVGNPWTQARMSLGLGLHKPKAVLQVGLAGAYEGRGLSIGDMVAGRSEIFGDLGVEEPEESREIGPGFKPIGSMPWADARQSQPMPLAAWPKAALAAWPDLKMGAGVSVNTVTGTDASARRLSHAFQGDYETLEGAGCALACSLAGVPCFSLRAISNKVGRRDMRPELFAQALKNLTLSLGALRKPFLASLPP